MKITKMLYEDLSVSPHTFGWCIFDSDDGDTPTLSTGEAATEEEAMEKGQKEYERLCMELGADLV